MSCPCTSRALRLFIRNVAQVDLAASNPSTYRPRRTNLRMLNSPSLPFLQPSYLRAYSSGFPSQSVKHTTEDVSIAGQDETFSAAKESQNTAQDEIDDVDDLFMEITPESIDALAAEIRAELANSKSRESERSGESIEQMGSREQTWIQREPIDIFSKPMKKPRWHSTEVEKTRFRSVKIDNAVSYSPPANTSKRNMGKSDWTPPRRETWMAQKAALKEKFPEGWKPMKRLSPEAQVGIRALHAHHPEQYSTAVLANHFKTSAEAIRRILRTKWVPSPEEEADRERRWFQRGQNVWSRYAELGLKPPKKWREEGIGRGKPEWKKRAVPILTTSRPGSIESPKLEISKSLDDDMEDRIL